MLLSSCLFLLFEIDVPKCPLPVGIGEGINFLKNFFGESPKMGVHFGTLCPNE